MLLFQLYLFQGANILKLMRRHISGYIHYWRGYYHCCGSVAPPWISVNRQSTPTGAFCGYKGVLSSSQGSVSSPLKVLLRGNLEPHNGPICGAHPGPTRSGTDNGPSPGGSWSWSAHIGILISCYMCAHTSTRACALGVNGTSCLTFKPQRGPLWFPPCAWFQMAPPSLHWSCQPPGDQTCRSACWWLWQCPLWSRWNQGQCITPKHSTTSAKFPAVIWNVFGHGGRANQGWSALPCSKRQRHCCNSRSAPWLPHTITLPTFLCEHPPPPPPVVLVSWKMPRLMFTWDILVVPLSTSPVNIYIIHSSLRNFPITPMYYPMSLIKIETHNKFASFLFRIISVHSMKRAEINMFQQEIFLFGYAIALVSHFCWNKRIFHFQHNFYHPSNLIIDNYNSKHDVYQW